MHTGLNSSVLLHNTTSMAQVLFPLCPVATMRKTASMCVGGRGDKPHGEESCLPASVRLRAAEAGWPCFSWPQRRIGIGKGLAQTAWGDETWRRKKKTERHRQIKKLCLLLGREFGQANPDPEAQRSLPPSCRSVFRMGQGSQGTGVSGGGMWNGSPS